MGTCKTLAGTSLCASAWVAASIAPHIGAHIESIDATRRSSRVDPRTLRRDTRLVRAPKMLRINSVDRWPIPIEWNSRRRQTAADFLFARRLCAGSLVFCSTKQLLRQGATEMGTHTPPPTCVHPKLRDASPTHSNPSATARSPTTQHLGWRPG